MKTHGIRIPMQFFAEDPSAGDGSGNSEPHLNKLNLSCPSVRSCRKEDCPPNLQSTLPLIRLKHPKHALTSSRRLLTRRFLRRWIRS
nr:MAG TPA: hypothetical protein [Caudoviricetes sp.]